MQAKHLMAILCCCGLASGMESFESLPVGGLTSAHLEYGELSAEAGHMAIDQGHATHGSKALHIKGGENRSAVLVLDEPLASDTRCEFRLERWTGAAPFVFTFTAGHKELLRETKLSTGRGKGHYNLVLPAGTQKLTFSCTSPAKGGALVDEFIIHTGNMEIKDVAVTNPGVYPLMKRALHNPAMRIDYTTRGSDNPLTPGTITFKVTPGTVSEVALCSGNDSGTEFNGSVVYGTATPDAEGKVTLTCDRELRGSDRLWVDVKLDERVDVGSQVTFSDFKVKAGEIEYTSDIAPVKRDVGYLLALPGESVAGAANGEEGRPCVAFRIPGMITTAQGTLVGCFDARYLHGADLCADIDVAVVRSTDGGQTWTKPEVAMDCGPGVANGCGDPAIVQDPATKRIWIQALACHFSGGASLAVSKTGQDPAKTGQWEMTYSDDDGLTWATEHVNPTKQIKKDEWTCILAGPGRAITTRSGIIVYPAQIWQRGAPLNCRSTICYSADHGKTWVYGEGVPHRTSECQVVELEDGSLMLNCRNENYGGRRVVYVTKDLGKTWTKHSSDLKSLKEPTCQASLISIDNGRRLLFSNPKSNNGRRNMTVRYSDDGGATWNEGYEYDTRGCAGYSCLTMVDDQTVGVIYEAAFPGANNVGLAIGFLRIPLQTIVDTPKSEEEKK